MKERRFFSVLAMAGLAVLSAHAQTPDRSAPDTLKDCGQTKDLSRAIAACGEAIGSGSKDAQVYVNRGFAYFLKDDYDHALADLEEAIRLDPKAPAAFARRGLVFRAKGDDDRAIADFDKALELGSSDPRILTDRGLAYLAKGETGKSIADLSAAIQRGDAGTFDGQLPYLLRGIAHLYDGAPDKALADFKKATELDPKVPHFAIWRHLAERRTGSTSDLASAARSLDMTKWPAPVIRMFMGEETPAAVLAVKGMTCEADYFVAEFRYLQNQKEEAVRLYKAALEDCPRYYLEAVAASAALRTLGVKP